MRKSILVAALVAVLVGGIVTGMALAEQGKANAQNKEWTMYCEKDSPVPFWQAICDMWEELNTKVDIMDNPEKAERGCLACHYPNTMYSLNNSTYLGCSRIPNETREYACYGVHQQHVNESNDDLQTCLGCHNGTAALNLSEILHPVHMTSHPFKYYHDGSCFSCHKIQDGEYEVIYNPMPTHGLGVPNESYDYFT